MKKSNFWLVMSVLVLALSTALMSCASYAPASEKDSTYSETVNVPGVSAADLYAKAHLWFTDTFKGPDTSAITVPGFNVPEKSRIISADRNKGTIQANYTFLTDMKQIGGSWLITIYYSPVELQVSDGQYRLVFSTPMGQNFVHSFDNGQTNYSDKGALLRRDVETAKKVRLDLASALRETVGGTVAGN